MISAVQGSVCCDDKNLLASFATLLAASLVINLLSGMAAQRSQSR